MRRRLNPLSVCRLLTAAISFASIVTPSLAAESPADALLSVDQIFAREPLTGRIPASITWAPDGSRFLYTLPGGESGSLDTHLYDVKAGRGRLFFRAAANGKGARPAPEFVWSPDSRRLAFLDGGDLWVVAADGSGRIRLTGDADDPQWSPDSSRIAFVHANDLYAIRARGGRPQRYSFDGSPYVSNGEPDWVYSEELDMHHAFRWSPDGTQIAYLQFDERSIDPFPIVDFLDPRNRVTEQRYPLAGGRNSIVSLRVAGAGGSARTVYSNKSNDNYIAAIGWTPSGLVAASLIDRTQKRLRYVTFAGTSVRTLVAEHDARWVDFHGAPVWLADKRHFLFISDRDGLSALYIGDARSNAARRLTQGYAVQGVAGIDDKLHIAYVDAAFPTRRDRTVLMIPLRGGIARPLARGHGTHTFVMALNGRNFVRSDSAFGIPPVFTIGSTLGGGLKPFVRSISLASRNLGPYALSEIQSSLGKLDAWMMKPPDFDASKRYPVIMYVYGGPAAPTTADDWSGQGFLFSQALAQRGFIVFSIDGPASQVDSAQAVRRLYLKLGPASLAGQLAGVAYLKTLPYVDAGRIGLWGWSFGGYETTYAMTHAPGTWKVGIAVAPVTDWKLYDTIYTERYMGTPGRNALAYQESSSVAAAAHFTGKLLISHGTSDDNVHIANSVSLLQAFVLNGKQADFMLYPRKNHSISGIPQRRHLFNHMLEYWRAHL